MIARRPLLSASTPASRQNARNGNISTAKRMPISYAVASRMMTAARGIASM